VVNDLMTSRMQQFEHLVADELPGVLDDLGLDRTARGHVDTYVTGLQLWMAGIVDWHRTVDRYKESELRSLRRPAPRLTGPTGFGTSAARIASRFSGKLV
jgi:germacradienol/geosmin synthase